VLGAKSDRRTIGVRGGMKEKAEEFVAAGGEISHNKIVF